MDELYSVDYRGINLYAYEMTDCEREISENLRRELIGICEGLGVPGGKCFDGSPYRRRLLDNDEFVLKYREDTGYYALTGERGKFSFMDGFPTEDRKEAKFLLLKDEFEHGGFLYELGLRDVLKEEWAGRYSGEYDSRKKAFEYAIKCLKTVFGCLPDGVIREYEDYMNKWFEGKHWRFDRDNLTFEET
jgi:hypothetical protein